MHAGHGLAKLTRMHTPPHTQAELAHPTLRFVRRGQAQALANVPPTRTLLELLRDDLGHTGTKEGCRSGDCGACTVVLGEPDGQGGLRYRAVNSCIKPAQSIQGLALWTAEDLTADPLIRPTAPEPVDPVHADPGTPAGHATCAPRTTLHPVQQALVTHHASQCGFCTPGFVMSLFAQYQSCPSGPPMDREQALTTLSGNLCRCTGYRPLLDAAQTLHQWPRHAVDEAKVIQLLEQTNQYRQALDTNFFQESLPPSYFSPTDLPGLLQARTAWPKAQLVAGCTDVGLWITKGQQQPTQVLDLTRVAELRHLGATPQGLVIGAAVSLTDAFAALVASRPALSGWASRFAGLPVRNAGTLGGNVANGSPIGDSMPVLLALGARVRLMAWAGDGQAATERELPLEDFYLGYRQTALAANEVLTHILVPAPGQPWVPPPRTTSTPPAVTAHGQWLRAYKISKRFEDDISAVCLGLQLELDQGRVTSARLGVGGVAATPVRARQTEAALADQAWNADTVALAMAVLGAEFTPISDMRASATYRRQVLGALLRRAWLESQGHTATNLEHTDRLRLVAAQP